MRIKLSSGEFVKKVKNTFSFSAKFFVLSSLLILQLSLSEIFLYQDDSGSSNVKNAKADGGITLVSEVSVPVGGNTTSVSTPEVIHHRGNLIAVLLTTPDNGPFSVTDAQGNTYTAVGAPRRANGDIAGQWFYAFAKETSSNVVTGHLNSGFQAIRAVEYSGISPVDPVDTHVEGDGAATPAFTTTNAYDLVLAAFQLWNGTSCTAGSDYTMVGTCATGGNNRVVEQRITTSTLNNSTTTLNTDGNIPGNWLVAFKGAGYAVTAPADGGVINSASGNFTVTPINNYTGDITITPSGGGLGAGNAVTRNFNNSSTPQTFTITPTSAGTVTLTLTNNGGLANPAPMTYVAATTNATSYTFVSPGSGYTGVTSQNFTVTPNGYYNGTITITPSGGGLTDPLVLTFSSSAPQTFTVKPTSAGTVTLTPVNNHSLANPSNATYTAYAGITLVSVTHTDIEGASNISVSAPASTHHQGNLIAVLLATNGNGPLSVTDTQGNTYTGVGTPYRESGDVLGQWFYTFAGATGSNIVTGHFQGGFYSIRVMEYSGISHSNPVDIYTWGSSPGNASSLFTTTNAHDLVLAGFHSWASFVAGSNYTLVGNGGGGTRPVVQRETSSILTDSVAPVIPTGGNVEGGWVVAFRGEEYSLAASSSSGLVGSASGNFTVTPNLPYTGTVTITPSGGGLTDPIILTFNNSNTPQTFTITPTSAGTVTLTPTSSGGLGNPANLTYATAATATSYTLSFPAVAFGPADSASGNFTVTPNGIYNGTVIVTPSGGGLSAPITLTFNNSIAAQNFTITPTAAGTVALTSTNSGGLTNPSNATYTVLPSVTLVSDTSGGTQVTHHQGNLIAVWLTSYNNSQQLSITDTQENTYIPVGTQYAISSGPPITAQWFYTYASATGSNTVSCHHNGGIDFCRVLEYSGIASSNPVDTYVYGDDVNFASPAFTTTNYHDLILAGWHAEGYSDYIGGSDYTVFGTLGTGSMRPVEKRETVSTLADSTASILGIGGGSVYGSWVVAFKALEVGSPATTYTIAPPSPSSGNVGSPSGDFTVTPDGTYYGTITITPSGGGLSTPIVLTFNHSSAAQTFTITPTSAGTVTLAPTNNNGLTNPANATYTANAVATSYTLTSPSPAGGTVGTTSGNFTVTPNGVYTGTITITPAGGGLSAAVVLTFDNSSTPQTFTITPTGAGIVTLAPTNNHTLTDPSGVAYTASNPSNGGGNSSSAPVIIKTEITSVHNDTVNLSLDVTNVIQMTLSDDPLFTDASWESYITTKTYTKTSFQTKVYLKFKSFSGRNSSTVELTIPAEITPANPINPATSSLSSNYPDGTLLKLPDSGKIYVVIDGKKEWISTPEVFEQLGYEWTNIQTVPSSELDTLTDFEDNLIRQIGDYKVYLVVNGIKRHIPNPEIFLGYGFKWGDIKDVPKETLGKYKSVNLVKESSKYGIYYVGPQEIRKLMPSTEVFNSYNYKTEDIQIISKTEMDFYPLSNLINLNGSNDIYLIEGNIKKHIPNIQVFNKYKLNWSLVMSVNQTEFNYYQDGGELK